MIIDCISDLHGFYPDLPGGDLLIIAGDWTARDTEPECFEFFNWLHEQEYEKKIVIAGNHDNRAQREDYKGPTGIMKNAFTYLCDSGTEFEGLKIWGSPWTKTFEGMNPHCKAFTCDTEEELKKKFDLIPSDVDILITHSPPYSILDEVEIYDCGAIMSVGSIALYDGAKTFRRFSPQLWVFGHIHEGYGTEIFQIANDHSTLCVNASHVNQFYKPINEPIRVIL